MALELEVNGVVYDNALNIRASRSLHNLCGYFEVNSSIDPDNLLPVKAGDAIRVLADGVSVMNGYIETLEVGYDDTSHSIYIFGRDRTGDMFDSTVSGSKSFSAPASFLSIVRSVLDAGNMAHIGIVNQAIDAPDFAAGETIEAEVGQTIFGFLEPYARKLQIVMTTNGDGDVLLLRAGNTSSGLRLARGENIKSASFKKKTTDIFYKYTSRAQLDPLGFDDAPAGEVVNQTGETAVDTSARKSRVLEFNVEEDMDNSTSFNRAQFEANIRRANAVNYSCVVQGHSLNGKPFSINTLAYVDDSFCGIASDMLIHSVEYSYTLNSGSTTKLQMTYKDAFTLNAQQEAREAARQSVGDDF